MKETWGWVDQRVHYINSACKEKIHARGRGIGLTQRQTVQFHQNTQVCWLLHTWSGMTTGLGSGTSMAVRSSSGETFSIWRVLGGRWLSSCGGQAGSGSESAVGSGSVTMAGVVRCWVGSEPMVSGIVVNSSLVSPHPR